MSATQASITIDVSDPRVGIWCERCALPSGYEFDVTRLKDDGVTLVSTFRRCTDCGQR